MAVHMDTVYEEVDDIWKSGSTIREAEPGRDAEEEVFDDVEDDVYHAREESVVADCDVCILQDLRCFYIHHSTQSSHWEPPWCRWRCQLGLPYGWEQAIDHAGRVYYIDHVNKNTTYTDPRSPRIPTGIRTVTLRRDPSIGYGFVAAGEHPVVVQFVSPGGPSDGSLFANDRILSVNGENVEGETKEEVVGRVRQSTEQITLTVQQLPLSQRLPRRSCRVRFTDQVLISSPDSPDFPPFIPNVLRVFLENGQTRSFKYDSTTTVKDVFSIIVDKLQIRVPSYFSLALEYSLGTRSSKITLLKADDTLHRLASTCPSSHIRCVFRLSFIPLDPYILFLEDPRAFEYYYSQCLNDVVCGRFAFEMRYEACVRLAALHMQQLSLDSSLLKDGRVSVSRMEKEFGLATFLPTILLENVKRKEIRKHLRFYVKKDANTILQCVSKKCGKGEEPSQSSLMGTVDSRILTRLKYIQIVSHLPSFGCRSFSLTFRESQVDMLMQVDPRGGLLIRHPGKIAQPTISIAFDLIGRLFVQEETDILSVIIIRLNNNSQGLEFLVDKGEVDELVLFIQGYHLVQLKRELQCDYTGPVDQGARTAPPPYAAVHCVFPAGWNYSSECSPGERIVDFRESPPSYAIASTFTQTESLDKCMPSPPRPPSPDKPKSLLKAMDSLLIKNSRELQLKESTSPMLKRPSNPSGSYRPIGVSDSSDTDDSSWSEALSARESSLPPAVSFGLNSPDHLTRDSLETLIQSVHINPTNVQSLLVLFPDNICTDPDIIDLTSPTDGQKKFPLNDDPLLTSTDHQISSNPLSPESNLILPDPEEHPFHQLLVDTSEPHELAHENVLELSPPLRDDSHSNGSAQRNGSAPFAGRPPAPSIPFSNTCPTMLQEDIADFLRRSNSIDKGDGGDEPLAVRRMSLKEFTGLDSPRRRNDFSLSHWKDPSHSSLLSSFSARRRSLFSSRDEEAFPTILSPQQEEEPLEISAVVSRMPSFRISDLRSSLADRTRKLPNASPKKRIPIEEEKKKLLEAAQGLSRTGKALVGSATQSGHWQGLLPEILSLSEAVANTASEVISRLGSVFHAQLLSTKTDQVLKVLSDMLSSSESTSEVIRLSPIFAASLTQLIQTVASQ